MEPSETYPGSASDGARVISDQARTVSDMARDASDQDLRDVAASLATTAQKIVEVADTLVPAMKRLASSNETLAAKNRQKNFVIIALVALLAGGALLGWRLQSQSVCFANWANSSTNRTGTLGPLSNTRNDALGQLGLDLIQKASPEVSTADAQKFLTAEFKYDSAYTANPVPDSPKFNCPAF